MRQSVAMLFCRRTSHSTDCGLTSSRFACPLDGSQIATRPSVIFFALLVCDCVSGACPCALFVVPPYPVVDVVQVLALTGQSCWLGAWKEPLHVIVHLLSYCVGNHPGITGGAAPPSLRTTCSPLVFVKGFDRCFFFHVPAAPSPA